jgi:hypothetical protein
VLAPSATFLVLLAACSRDRPPAAAAFCRVEHIDVTWPATIERGGVTKTERLWATLTPTNAPAPEVFDSLAKVLVRGRPTGAAVMWSVPAFDTDPGGIAVVHKAALTPGETLHVAGTQEGAGWGMEPQVPPGGAAAGVEAGEFLAQEVTGTIVVLATDPLALRLDLAARDSAGDTIHVRGDASFSYRRQREACVNVSQATSPQFRVPSSEPRRRASPWTAISELRTGNFERRTSSFELRTSTSEPGTDAIRPPGSALSYA